MLRDCGVSGVRVERARTLHLLHLLSQGSAVSRPILRESEQSTCGRERALPVMPTAEVSIVERGESTGP